MYATYQTKSYIWIDVRQTFIDGGIHTRTQILHSMYEGKKKLHSFVVLIIFRSFQAYISNSSYCTYHLVNHFVTIELTDNWETIFPPFQSTFDPKNNGLSYDYLHRFNA